MSQIPGSFDSELGRAADLIRAGNKKEARLLLRDVLAGDENNLKAWELLYRASYNTQEQAFCLNKLIQLRPNHPWAAQQLAALNTSAVDSPAFYTSSTPARRSQKQKKKRQPSLTAILSGVGLLGLLCVGLVGVALFQAGFLPFSPGNLTATALAKDMASCQAVIQKAMQASSQYCDQIGPNKACYGNTTIRADLAAGATQRFSQRGDVVDVNQLQRITAAPLNLETSQWGIAIFNVMANLPRSLPGETVKLVVFGNTTLSKDTPTLESFYFSNELGQVACQQVPSDGILITMPNGTGVSFTINGTQMVLMGDASLTATKNGDMQINLYDGSGQITSGGQTEYMGGGEGLKVPLGGPDGNQADGPPSPPIPLPPDGGRIFCTIHPEHCPNGNVPTPATAQIEKTIQAGLGTFTPTPSQTAAKTSTPTIGPGSALTRTATPSPTSTTTLFVLPSPTLSPVPSIAPSLTNNILTTTRTSQPTLTGTRTPATSTRTPTVTPLTAATRTPTRTRTATLTHTLTPPPSRTFTATQTHTPTSTRTITPTPTVSNTPTDTLTPTITDTPAPTPTPTDTPIACSSLAVGSLTASGTQLQISLTNNFGTPINIQEVDYVWDSSTGTRLKTILLDATTIWTGSVPSPQAITAFIAGTTIANGATATLILDFTPKTAPTGTSLTVITDQGCQIQASN